MSNYLHFGTPTMGLEASTAYGVASDTIFWVDGTKGSDGNTGRTPKKALKTIQKAIDRVSPGGIIYILPRDITALATDPVSYEETLVIGNDTPGISLIGVGTGRVQGGLPQLKDYTSTSPILSVRAPGCRIANLGFNGSDNTAGGIELYDDGGTTYVAFGTTIESCHFKNCQGSGNATTGGAVYWTASGGAWQVRIADSLFYNNRAGIVLKGTSGSRPQDVVIENCVFQSSANTTVDADIYLAGGSGVNGLTIRDCDFSTVDVPAYASSPAAARYLDLTGCTNGSLMDCNFACISQGTSAKTFGAAGDGALIPTTVRMGGCHGEAASDATGDSGDIFRT